MDACTAHQLTAAHPVMQVSTVFWTIPRDSNIFSKFLYIDRDYGDGSKFADTCSIVLLTTSDAFLHISTKSNSFIQYWKGSCGLMVPLLAVLIIELHCGAADKAAAFKSGSL
jgi:hypothetical protein